MACRTLHLVGPPRLSSGSAGHSPHVYPPLDLDGTAFHQKTRAPQKRHRIAVAQPPFSRELAANHLHFSRVHAIHFPHLLGHPIPKKESHQRILRIGFGVLGIAAKHERTFAFTRCNAPLDQPNANKKSHTISMDLPWRIDLRRLGFFVSLHRPNQPRLDDS